MINVSGPPAGSEDFGSLLRTYRLRKGLTGEALGELAGVSQTKVSRIETGKAIASQVEVRRLVDVLGLTADETDRLVGLATTGRPSSSRSVRGQRQQIPYGSQVHVGQQELASREIRIFQPNVIAGLLQTSGYAEAILRTPLRLSAAAGADDAESALLDAVNGRRKRQQILKDDSKSFVFVMVESVLADRLVSPEDMLAQIRRIREVARRDNVSIRIVPAEAALEFPPLHSFELLDDRIVLIDLFHALVTTELEADVAVYQELFRIATEASVAEIDEILDKYVDLHRAALRTI